MADADLWLILSLFSAYSTLPVQVLPRQHYFTSIGPLLEPQSFRKPDTLATGYDFTAPSSTVPWPSLVSGIDCMMTTYPDLYICFLSLSKPNILPASRQD